MYFSSFFSVTNQCSNNNGGCSQLCLLTPFGRKCSCSEGLILKHDGKTCHGNTKRFTIKFDKTIHCTVVAKKSYENSTQSDRLSFYCSHT